ncbi:ribonucleotide-diphosphate reductase subunit alpha, partial [Escherichia coli]
FSPNEVPGLYEAFCSNQKEFEKLYKKYEADPSIRKKSVSAVEVFSTLMTERAETGRIYIQNIDHANTHSTFIESIAPIEQSNLCQEIALPSVPFDDINTGEGLISLCTLSAINWGNFDRPEDMETACDLSVRALDSLLDYQDYPVVHADRATKMYRPLGVGIINFAYFLAKRGLRYNEAALETVNEWAEAWSYYLIKSSVQLAKEKGKCEGFDTLKYAKGILPIDTYKEDIDALVSPELKQDWETLRQDIKQYGIRNATTMALMPAETSAQISNSTNGIEKPRSLVTKKLSKDGILKQVVPEISKLKNKYDLLWDQKDNIGYLQICGVLQKYIDQSISVNTSYNPAHFPDGKLP